MRLETELDRLGIKYTVEIINDSKVIIVDNVRVHIYKDKVLLCTKNDNTTLPPTLCSLKYVLEVIKNGKK